MTPLRNFLTEDHRYCDDLLALAETSLEAGNLSTAQEAFETFVAAMNLHFEAEETLLFPAFEQKTGMTSGPTQVMRFEHEQMRSLMLAAVDDLKTGEIEEYQGLLETLLMMMQQHNMKEENVLYPMCDQHLSDDVPEVLGHLKSLLEH